MGFPDVVVIKNPPANSRDMGSIPGLRRCPGIGNATHSSKDIVLMIMQLLKRNERSRYYGVGFGGPLMLLNCGVGEDS